MKSKFIIILLTVGFATINLLVKAQSTYDLRINEVMLVNTDNYEDGYGQKSAWIEIFNTAYNKVNIAGCYLTDDINTPRKYRIPSGDPGTVIPMRQFQVFWADNRTEHGTFHLNFVLDSTHRFVALFAGDGKTLIDSVTIPLTPANHSYIRETDGIGEWMISPKTTPRATNYVGDKESVGEKFKRYDPIGISMVIISMSVVFIALLLLYRVFRLIGKVNVKAAQRRSGRSKEAEGLISKLPSEEISGEVFAAISAALYMYETEKHDQESAIVTIQRVSKLYSPWSSKIYGLRQMPPKQHIERTKK
jgi:Na+-transporting methylmalonyl-CoA/oxaloacetate decarboxylase gamma subunit